jgi:hypothetical protein
MGLSSALFHRFHNFVHNALRRPRPANNAAVDPQPRTAARRRNSDLFAASTAPATTADGNYKLISVAREAPSCG